MSLPKLIFSPFKEGGTLGKPESVQYFITQNHEDDFVCHWSGEKFSTLEEAQAEAQKHYRKSIAE